MHFLCLHGMGTSAHVFETQFAGIRHELDKHHTFDFAEGTVECPIAPVEIIDMFPSRDTYFRYFWDTAESMTLALKQLATYVDAEGPFDGVLAFSQGAQLVSSYLIALGRQTPICPPPFKCVIFLCGARPFASEALARGELECVTVSNKPLIGIVTAHIWGQNDSAYGEQSQVLCDLCDADRRVIFVHAGGHGIPGPRAKADFQGSVRAIRRAIDMAERQY